MAVDFFTISEVMFLLDIVKLDKIEWCKIGDDKSVIDEYDSIIKKLENRLKEYNGFNNAIRSLEKSNIKL